MTKADMIKNMQELANQRAINAQYNGNHCWRPDVYTFLNGARWMWNQTNKTKITDIELDNILTKAAKV